MHPMQASGSSICRPHGYHGGVGQKGHFCAL